MIHLEKEGHVSTKIRYQFISNCIIHSQFLWQLQKKKKPGYVPSTWGRRSCLQFPKKVHVRVASLMKIMYI